MTRLDSRHDQRRRFCWSVAGDGGAVTIFVAIAAVVVIVVVVGGLVIYRRVRR